MLAKMVEECMVQLVHTPLADCCSKLDVALTLASQHLGFQECEVSLLEFRAS